MPTVRVVTELVTAALQSHFHLPRLDGQRHAFFSAHFDTELNGLPYVCECLVPRTSLADTAWDGRTFGYPDSKMRLHREGGLQTRPYARSAKGYSQRNYEQLL